MKNGRFALNQNRMTNFIQTLAGGTGDPFGPSDLNSPYYPHFYVYLLTAVLVNIRPNTIQRHKQSRQYNF